MNEFISFVQLTKFVIMSQSSANRISGGLEVEHQSPNNASEPHIAQPLLEGLWNDSENLKFSVFMDINRGSFSSKGRRKSEKIFIRLSEYLSSRTARQCRSHYQKMILKYHTVSKMRSHFRKVAGISAYDAELSNLRQFLSNFREQSSGSFPQKKERKYEDKFVQTDDPQPQQGPAAQLPANTPSISNNTNYLFPPAYQLSQTFFPIFSFMPPSPYTPKC